jgi:hypothetical protein
MTTRDIQAHGDLWSRGKSRVTSNGRSKDMAKSAIRAYISNSIYGCISSKDKMAE